MKLCKHCNQIKPFDSFRPDARIKSGLSSWCKPCSNKRSNESKKKNPEKLKLRDRRKYEKKMRRLYGDSYVVGSESNIKRRGGRKEVLSPEEARIRHNVRRVTRRAVANGKIAKMPCQVCGHHLSEIHHPDYSKPLDVIWLCPTHHREIHIKESML